MVWLNIHLHIYGSCLIEENNIVRVYMVLCALQYSEDDYPQRLVFMVAATIIRLWPELSIIGSGLEKTENKLLRPCLVLKSFSIIPVTSNVQTHT